MTYTQPQLAPVHATDGEESRLAAALTDGAGQYRKVLLALYEASGPLTDDELGRRCGLLRTSAGTRRGVAVKEGLVVKAGRGVSALGNPAARWTLTPAGVAFVARMKEQANAA